MPASRPPSSQHGDRDLGLVDEKIKDPDHVESVSHVVTIDNIQVLGLGPDDADFYLNFSPEKRKQMLWKVSTAPPRGFSVPC